jgi:hypothetical protein
MTKLFTKYLFIWFILPIIMIVIIFNFLPTQFEVGYFGVNRTINFNKADAIFGNTIYNFSFFLITYPVYFMSYFIVFLIRKNTDFNYSIIHFSMFMMNFILLSVNAENRFLIPLSVICFIFFILNIFKTLKIFN